MKITQKISKGFKSQMSVSEYEKSSGLRTGRERKSGMSFEKSYGSGYTVKAADDVEDIDDDERVGSLRIYLSQVCATPLLSKEQEMDLGRRIREAFDALLLHMLGSGYVLEVLLDRADEALGKKATVGQRREALEVAVDAGRSVLSRARGCVAAGAVMSAELRSEIKSVFGSVVAALDVWPSFGAELLELLTSRQSLSAVASDARAGNVDCVPKDDFLVVNLMDGEASRLFIAEGMRLKREALVWRNRLVDANLRLVVSFAGKMKHAFLSKADLIQEGSIGLVNAAERFDERLGNRFSTFAVNLIKAAMRRENDNQGRTIRLPVHQCEALRRLEQARVNLEHQLGRAPSSSELAEETGFKRDAVLELAVLREGTVSFQALGKGETDANWEDFVADPESLKPFNGESELSGCFDRLLCTLEEGQRRVISFLYGLGGVPRLSVTETAAELSIRAAEVARLHRLGLDSIRTGLSAGAGSYACAA